MSNNSLCCANFYQQVSSPSSSSITLRHVPLWGRNRNSHLQYLTAAFRLCREAAPLFQITALIHRTPRHLVISHATTQYRGRKKGKGGRKHEMYFASSKQRICADWRRVFREGQVELKGTQYAHCRDIYSLLKSNSIYVFYLGTLWFLMSFYAWILSVSSGVSQS